MGKLASRMMVVLGGLLALLIVPVVSAQSTTAKVRVVHASPDAPAVDVYVNGNKTLSNVPFFTASDYLDLPGGSYDIKVTPAGDANTAVIDAKGVAIEGGKQYTVAATGRLAQITPTILSDNLAAPAAGKAHVRVVHASPDAPAVDVRVKGGPTLISNLAFQKDSGYLPVDAGTYDLEVVPTGQNTVVINLPGTALEAGKIYDVFAVGLVGDNTLKAEVTTPAPLAASTTSAPSTLPATGANDMPVALFGVLAAMMIAAGFVMRRQMR